MTARLAIAMLLLAAPAAAQPAPAPAAASPTPAAAAPAATAPAAAATAPAPAPSTAPARPGRRDPRVIEIDEIVVQGEVQRPEAFYVLQRSELDFKGQEPRRSFIPLIIQSVEEEPFR